jgi:hypothetical protein
VVHKAPWAGLIRLLLGAGESPKRNRAGFRRADSNDLRGLADDQVDPSFVEVFINTSRTVPLSFE